MTVVIHVGGQGDIDSPITLVHLDECMPTTLLDYFLPTIPLRPEKRAAPKSETMDGDDVELDG